MCGIAGLLGYRGDDVEYRLRAMAHALSHRGPDHQATWHDREAGIGLSHARLSVIDLSAGGHQPMFSHDGRYALVTNGEIYNYRELKKELETLGHVFRSTSDTEVMLGCFSQWGIEASLRRFNGMFAFAVWDREQRALTLARDRIGEKPLYYAQVDGTIAFASELQALVTASGARPEVDRESLALLVSRGYIPAPHCIYAGTTKLPAGCLVTMTADGETAPRRWWNPRELIDETINAPLDCTPTEAIEHLDQLLVDSVSRRLLADVPVGAFLSGGVDSSLVVAIARRLSGRSVKTFTVGFDDPSYDESPSAQAVASHLETEHTELRVTAADMMDLMTRQASLYGEPMADPSQIPLHLVAKLAREQVTVVLSGDGGDELFGGYPRYDSISRLWRQLSLLPRTLRRGLKHLPWLRPTVSPHGFGKADRLAEASLTLQPDELYQLSFSQCPNPEASVLGSRGAPTLWDELGEAADFPALQVRWMYLDLVTYLPENVLPKLDRATMQHGLEGRIPLLDPEIVRFAWRLPEQLKPHRRSGKWLLRQVLSRYVPSPLVERPKAGFELPLGDWLRGPLRPWCESLLDARKLRDEGFFHAEVIRRRWHQHLSGYRDWRFFLWSVLMFQQWHSSHEATGEDPLAAQIA